LHERGLHTFERFELRLETKDMPMQLRTLILTALAVVPAWSHALAISALNQLFPGDEITNAIVRVRAGPNEDSWGRGSGTIIDRRPDESGPGGWICVLTADHVVSFALGSYDYQEIGFGGESAPGLRFKSTTTVINVVRGPVNPDGSRVDMAILGIRVPDLSVLPDFEVPTIASPGTTHTVAGYGQTATFDGANRRYLVDPGVGGDLLVSFNTFADLTVKSISFYEYASIRYTTEFGPTDPTMPAIHAEAHTLRGDSGGPSWRASGSSGWSIVGVHSASTSRLFEGRSWVGDHDEWWDVQVDAYSDWVRTGCAAAVPEPASLLALTVGFAACLRRRTRR